MILNEAAFFISLRTVRQGVENEQISNGLLGDDDSLFVLRIDLSLLLTALIGVLCYWGEIYDDIAVLLHLVRITSISVLSRLDADVHHQVLLHYVQSSEVNFLSIESHAALLTLALSITLTALSAITTSALTFVAASVVARASLVGAEGSHMEQSLLGNEWESSKGELGS